MSNRKRIATWSMALATVVSAALLVAASPSEPPVGADTPKPAANRFTGDPYPLETCIVSGEKFSGTDQPVTKVYDEREIRFCCKGCSREFERDQAKYIAKIDEQIIASQLAHYPLKTCVVMEEDSLEEGSPVNVVYGNRLVRFCCNDCVKKFKADPAKYLAKLNKAVIDQQKSIYPLDTCAMSGEKLGEDSVDRVHGVTLIRFCCKRCEARFAINPLPVMAKVHQAWAAKHKAADDPHAGHDHH